MNVLPVDRHRITESLRFWVPGRKHDDLPRFPAGIRGLCPPREGELGKLLPPVHDRKVCFARTYDAAHLREHPKQKVQSLLFQIRYHRHDPEKGNPQGQRNYYFGMAAKVMGQTKTLYASGECTSGGGGIHCGVECDGGGVDLRHDPKTGTLTLSYDKLIPRIRMTVGCDGEDNTVDLTPGADDRVFRLSRANPSACRSLNGKM
jgi:hypothetical protein